MPNNMLGRNTKTGQMVCHEFLGTRFGHLVAIEKLDKRNHGYIIWKFQCDCGNIIERPSYSVTRGLESCGCDSVAGRPRIPNNGAYINHVYETYRKSAKARNLVFTLTKDDVRALITQDCSYCGAAPRELKHGSLGGYFESNGIDRMNNDEGYIRSNCTPCCTTCNIGKRTRNVVDFDTWVKKIYEYRRLDAA